MYFSNRSDAGTRLANELADYKHDNPLILGVSRGGVAVAQRVATLLDAQLDVIVVGKICAPDPPGTVIGAVAADGTEHVDKAAVIAFKVPGAYVHEAATKQKLELATQEKLYREARAEVPPQRRVVILVDDGAETGATLTAAIKSLRAKSPAKIVVALPIGTLDAVLRLQRHADKVICLKSPLSLIAPGQFYNHFNPVTERDVARMLRENAKGEKAGKALEAHKI